ncbi:MAG: oligosaccharide flippase family protein [Alphaproteobacteria bacterium]|nr:oligosaccharide flippase family protein [Alphaproteobacteria bacterium]
MLASVLSSQRLLGLVPKKLMVGAAWNGLAQIMYRGLVILGMLIAARILGLERFGQLSILYNTTMTFHVVASLGLIMTGTKLVAELSAKDKARTGRIMALCHYVAAASGGLVGLGMLLGAPWIAAEILNDAGLASGVRLTALLLLFQVLADSTLGINLGFLAFRGIFVTNAITGIAAFILLIAGAHYQGVAGALLGLALAEAIRFLLLFRLAHRSAQENAIPLRWRFPREEMPVLWHVSLPSMATAILWLPVTWIGTLMLVRQPGGFAEMGLFGAANQWFSLLLFVPGVVTQTILPILSGQVGDGGRLEARSLALKSAGIMLALVALISAPLMLASPWITAAYGPDFEAGVWVFVLMLTAAIAAAPQGILGNFLAAESRFWLRFRLNLLWAACFLAAAHYLVVQGAAGLGIALIIAYAIRTLATLAFVLRVKASAEA